jgi:hypothetical protein
VCEDEDGVCGVFVVERESGGICGLACVDGDVWLRSGLERLSGEQPQGGA